MMNCKRQVERLFPENENGGCDDTMPWKIIFLYEQEEINLYTYLYITLYKHMLT